MKNTFEKPIAYIPAEKKPERKTTISRVLMKSAEDEERALELFADVFDNQDPAHFEREKTEEELEIIHAVFQKMKGFMESYGATFTDITEDHVHIVDPQKLRKNDWKALHSEGGAILGGWHLSVMQNVFINRYRHDDLVTFTSILAHELIHMHNFQSMNAQWKDDEKDALHFRRRRDGMTIFSSADEKDNVHMYFHWLEEAVTQELTRRFAVENFEDMPQLAHLLKYREDMMPHLSKADLYTDSYIRTVHKRGFEETVKWGDSKTYAGERNVLNDLIDQIYQKNGDQFSSREDIFAVFAKAHFTGRLLPMARLIERTMGKGYMRKLAKEHEVLLPENAIDDKIWREK